MNCRPGRHGRASPGLVRRKYYLVLVWLLMLGAPVVQELALPPDAQTVVSNEYATLSIGLAITVMILQNRKR